MGVGVGVGAGIETLLLLVAASLPPGLVPVTRQVIVWPASSSVGVYVGPVAPGIGVPSRSHSSVTVGLPPHVPSSQVTDCPTALVPVIVTVPGVGAAGSVMTSWAPKSGASA